MPSLFLIFQSRHYTFVVIQFLLIINISTTNFIFTVQFDIKFFQGISTSLDLINIPIDNYYFAIIHPDILIDTKSARKILPKKIDLGSAIKQWGNVASLTYGFSSKNIDLIKKSMKDYIIEPVRSKLIPAYDNIKNTALDNGAIGCSISGSGPSVFALCEDRNKAEKILISMEKVLLDNSIKYHSYVTSVNNQGIEIL